MKPPLKQRYETIATIKASVGSELGISDWLLVDQPRIDAFAHATEDYNSIHVDPAAGAEWGLGGTIAHGLLTLSLLLKLSEDIVPAPAGLKSGYNYGLEHVRFIHPVKAGQRIRGRFKLADFQERVPGTWILTADVLIEIEGEAKPALSCQWLTIFFV